MTSVISFLSTPSGADDIARPDAAVDDEGKIARHRLEGGEFKRAAWRGHFFLGLGDAVEDDFECDQRAVGAEAPHGARMQFAKRPSTFCGPI